MIVWNDSSEEAPPEGVKILGWWDDGEGFIEEVIYEFRGDGGHQWFTNSGYFYNDPPDFWSEKNSPVADEGDTCIIDTEQIESMRTASYLLPDPGGEVVRQLLDTIKELLKEKGEVV